MLERLYGKWMSAWELALADRDLNRVLRPLEWGFDHLPPYDSAFGTTDLDRMVELNQRIASQSSEFFDYRTPTDFRLETRAPLLFPTNVRAETLTRDRGLDRKARSGKLKPATFLRFTSPVLTGSVENDLANARWFPATAAQQEKVRLSGKPLQAMIVMPQWNADAFSHNALCAIFNRFGVSCLRLSKPYHDIRRPTHLQRSDYAVSSNIGRTISACRQAVADIRSCVDWLQQQGYQQFGILGTSLGSCYAFIAAAHEPRLEVCAFNHASTWFGDVIWTGQSTRHIREALQSAGLTREDTRNIFRAISPMAYMEQFAAKPREVLVVYAPYDQTFLKDFSVEVLRKLDQYEVPYTSRVLPCGHYTTGETPYKFLDAWYLSRFIHSAFKKLAASNIEALSRETTPAELHERTRPPGIK